MCIALFTGCGLLLAGLVFTFLLPERETVVRCSKTILLVPALSSVAGVAINLLSLFQGASDIATILSACFFVIGAVVLLLYYRKKIEYTDSSFVIYPLLGRRKHHLMSEVVGITEGRGTTVLHLENEQKIRFEASGKTMQTFLAELDTYYKQVLHKGATLLEIQPRLFHGYVKNPWSFIGLFIVIGCFFLAAVILLACLCSKSAEEPRQTERLSVTEFSASVDEDVLHISTDLYEQPFTAIGFDVVLNDKEQTADAFLMELRRQKTLVISAASETLRDAAKGNCNYIRIYQLIGEDGSTLLKHSEITKGYQDSYRTGIYFVGAILVLHCFAAIAFCYIVNHAPKYPRIVRLLVKDSWLNF